MLITITFAWSTLSSQQWFSKIHSNSSLEESGVALLAHGDSIVFRANYDCTNSSNLCTILGFFDTKLNDFVKVSQIEDFQGGIRNITQNNESFFLSSEEQRFNNYISAGRFSNTTLELIESKNLKIDSSRYFNYTVGPSIQFDYKVILSGTIQDSLVFIDYEGWNNYQTQTVLFVSDFLLHTDTILLIPPSTGAFLIIEDIAVGPDSILYISFIERYLTPGSQNLYLVDRKVVYGYDYRFEKVFQWLGPNYIISESISSLAIGSDTTIYVVYKDDYKTFLGALNIDGSLKWNMGIDSSPGQNLYNIKRLRIASNGDIIGAGTISSIADSLGESGFIFRTSKEGELIWKKAFRVNLGFDLQLGSGFPFQSNLEDIIELPNGDLFAIGFVRKYVNSDTPEDTHNLDIWIIRTSSNGCVWYECPFIQDFIVKDNYFRLVSSESEWVVDSILPTGQTIINRFSFDPDSILINGDYYYELIYTPTVYHSWEGTSKFFKEKNGKIYILNQVDSTDLLLYDFHVQIGDTLKISEEDANNHSIVVDIGTITLSDDLIRKTVTTQCTHGEEIISSFWIEGIGDANIIFNKVSNCFDNQGIIGTQNIRCFLKNQQAIFSRSGIDDCYLTSVATIKNHSISIYPNPVKDYIEFNFLENVKNILLFNELGVCVLNQNINFGENKLDIRHLPAGLYFGIVNWENRPSNNFRLAKIDN